MRLSTKSILRPLRATLTRRRKSKKRGGIGGDNEPSSPKVTCIGQVRSKKSKRRVKRCRSVTNRPPPPRLIGEASFRNGDQRGSNDDKKMICSGSQRYSNSSAHYQSSQRWVHLPISVCDALRAFGAEFGRLFLCRRSCCFSSRESREKADGGGNGMWVVSVSEGREKREIEVVVDGGVAAAAAVEGRMSFKSSRRHLFEDIEVKDGDEEEEEERRVSVSIPPRNALLLMRCRSDPVKMAELGHRFSWDAASEHGKMYVEEDDGKNGGETTMPEEFEEEGTKDVIFMAKEAENVDEDFQIADKVDEEEVEDEEESKNDAETNISEGELGLGSEGREEEALVVQEEEEGEEVESNMSSFEAMLEGENTDQHDEHCAVQAGEEVEEEIPICHLSSSADSDKEANGGNEEVRLLHEEEEEKTEEEMDRRGNRGLLALEEEVEKQEEESPPALPECLLLMIREPKLSMEVSKETWVRGMDFIRRLPRRPAKAGGCGHDPVVKKHPSKPKPSVVAPMSRKCDQLPPRSSCSLPTAVAPVGKVIEPLVLTRCKSAPMRTVAAAAKLAPESCLWKNGGAEIDRRATIGVGAAGVGY